MLKMIESLNITLTSRDLRHTDVKVQLQAVCSQWLPLAPAVLSMCIIEKFIIHYDKAKLV